MPLAFPLPVANLLIDARDRGFTMPSAGMLWYTDEWTAEFTERLTVNIDSAIQAGIAGIKPPLESSIGAVNGRTQKFNTACGDRDIAPYTRTVYHVYQNVTLGKKTKVESTYTCY